LLIDNKAIARLPIPVTTPMRPRKISLATRRYFIPG
jgi:hypothetical protein